MMDWNKSTGWVNQILHTEKHSFIYVFALIKEILVWIGQAIILN
jgi:hypothetical protein